jgi:NAD(P)-dependent dehydrogenase (short-subunit alcohol dehydrogenase family)
MTDVIPEQQQDAPGRVEPMEPVPDHGEQSYEGHGRLAGKRTLITGADSGIGRAVAIAFAREGADVVVSYLEEDDDARVTGDWVERAGRRAELVRGDLADAEHCRSLVSRTLDALGGIDVLVNNAAFQRTYEQLEDVPDDEWDRHWQVNVSAMFHLSKASVPHMAAGSSIVNTASVNADQPKPTLLPYATTKGAIVNFSAGLAQLLGKRGIRVNSVLPGPVWTPLIPSTLPPEQVEGFGSETPLGRPAQPAEIAPVFVLLASDESSYVSGAAVPVTGGRPVI